MRKRSFWDIILANKIKSHVKGDQAYTCNLQPWITIFPGLYLFMRIALCRYINIPWHIWHGLHINKYIILWCVKYRMWRCQLRVWMSSVLIQLFACYLISLGLTPDHDTTVDWFLVGIRNTHFLECTYFLNTLSFFYFGALFTCFCTITFTSCLVNLFILSKFWLFFCFTCLTSSLAAVHWSVVSTYVPLYW